MAVLAVLPAAIILCLGFLTIKNVPWEGVPLSQIRSLDSTNAPGLFQSMKLQSEMGRPRSQNMNPLAYRVYESIQSQLADQPPESAPDGSIAEEISEVWSAQKMDQWLDDASARIAAAERSQEPFGHNAAVLTGNLPTMIENSIVTASWLYVKVDWT